MSWTALCRSCAREMGADAWCDGHADVGADLLAWAEGLPDEWATVCRVWWIATGEVRVDEAEVTRLALPTWRGRE